MLHVETIDNVFESCLLHFSSMYYLTWIYVYEWKNKIPLFSKKNVKSWKSLSSKIEVLDNVEPGTDYSLERLHSGRPHNTGTDTSQTL